MKKQYWWQSWARFFLWAHVVGIIIFYTVLLRRTAPKIDDRVKHLPSKRYSTHSRSLSGPMVSIIVPARNEEHNIQRCVQSLLEQDYEPFEVIVVDDDSTDATAQIVRTLAATHAQGQRLKILHLDNLPTGWAGKPHALHCGIQQAQGEWLLLTDADTWHAPQSLRSCVTHALSERLDLLTLWLTQELPTFWERVLMPMAYLGISFQYPSHLVNNPKSSVAVANGPYILLKREVYSILGGYARLDLCNTLLDDRDLARIVKKSGFKLRFMDGRGLVHIHMYNGLSDTWRGWRKNAFLGSNGGVGAVLLQLLGLPLVTILPFFLPLLTLLTRIKRRKGIGATEATVATVLELTPLLMYRSILNRHLNVPWYYSFSHPLAGALFEGILGQSAWRVLMRKGVDWRGRQYHDGKNKISLQHAEQSASPGIEKKVEQSISTPLHN